MPAGQTFDSTECKFIIKFNWQKKSISRKLCLPDLEWQGSIPISDLMSISELEQNLGALNSIEWTINFSTLESSGYFSFNFSVAGWVKQVVSTDSKPH